MRKTRYNGGFFLCLLINLLLNWEWSIPAWIFLVLHFVCDFSILWFIIALAAWILIQIFWMKLIGWARHCSRPDPPKENKNPYSVGAKKDCSEK